MLNAIATGVVQWLLLKVAAPGSRAATRSTPSRSRSPRGSTGLATRSRDATNHVYTLHPARRPRRASSTGSCSARPGSASTCAPPAAPRPRPSPAASRCPRMVLTSMITSGALAGLVGMPLLFGQDYSYGTTFQAGLGFAGIGIALLGRNNAIGIAFAALLWAYLDAAVQRPADPAPASPTELVLIIQGVILFAVVIAYELIRRAGRAPRAARVSPGSWPPHERPPAPEEGARGMSAAGLSVGTAVAKAPPPPQRRRLSPAAGSGSAHRRPIVVLSILRVVTGAEDIDSSGALTAAIGLAVPIGLAGLGGLWSERAGVVNIGLEGMMILGTWGAALLRATTTGPWVGILGAILARRRRRPDPRRRHGDLRRRPHRLRCGDQPPRRSAPAQVPRGALLQQPARRRPDPVAAAAGAADVIASRAVRRPGQTSSRQHIFFVSDLAGVLRALRHQRLRPHHHRRRCCSWSRAWVLWRTAFGLRLRSVGESPVAAETLGVNVLRYKFVAVLVSGGLAGLGGGFLALVAANIYRDGQTGGRGYIGLAAMIFGNWRPGGLLAGVGPLRLHRRHPAARRRRRRARVPAAVRRAARWPSGIWQIVRQPPARPGRSRHRRRLSSSAVWYARHRRVSLPSSPA